MEQDSKYKRKRAPGGESEYYKELDEQLSKEYEKVIARMSGMTRPEFKISSDSSEKDKKDEEAAMVAASDEKLADVMAANNQTEAAKMAASCEIPPEEHDNMARSTSPLAANNSEGKNGLAATMARTSSPLPATMAASFPSKTYSDPASKLLSATIVSTPSFSRADAEFLAEKILECRERGLLSSSGERLALAVIACAGSRGSRRVEIPIPRLCEALGISKRTAYRFSKDAASTPLFESVSGGHGRGTSFVVSKDIWIDNTVHERERDKDKRYDSIFPGQRHLEDLLFMEMMFSSHFSGLEVYPHFSVRRRNFLGMFLNKTEAEIFPGGIAPQNAKEKLYERASVKVISAWLQVSRDTKSPIAQPFPFLIASWERRSVDSERGTFSPGEDILERMSREIEDEAAELVKLSKIVSRKLFDSPDMETLKKISRMLSVGNKGFESRRELCDIISDKASEMGEKISEAFDFTSKKPVQPGKFGKFHGEK